MVDSTTKKEKAEGSDKALKRGYTKPYPTGLCSFSKTYYGFAGKLNDCLPFWRK